MLRGLLAPVRKLPPKLFYDARGAALFEQICALPEYYLTRAELEILQRRAGEIAAHLGPRCALIEYGSGAGVKIRLLLDALDAPVAYVPIDISGEQLAAVTADLRDAYPDVAILPLEADYTMPIALPELPRAGRRVAFFPGSTIGNFEPDAAVAFLRRIRHTVGDDGALILGADRVKAASVLEAAYDDAAGVTAEFNLNLLARLNRELGADFDLSRFRHRATFNAAERRIEMHLVSTTDQDVHIAGQTIGFKRGETIWTESSHKYDEPHLHRLATDAGFGIDQLWTDHDGRFWIGMLTAR